MGVRMGGGVGWRMGGIIPEVSRYYIAFGPLKVTLKQKRVVSTMVLT